MINQLLDNHRAVATFEATEAAASVKIWNIQKISLKMLKKCCSFEIREELNVS